MAGLNIYTINIHYLPVWNDVVSDITFHQCTFSTNADAREDEDGDKDVGQSDRTDTFTDYQVCARACVRVVNVG